jgi:hypothetical protein
VCARLDRPPRVPLGRHAGRDLQHELHVVVGRLHRGPVCGGANGSLAVFALRNADADVRRDGRRRRVGTVFGVHQSRCLRARHARRDDMRQVRNLFSRVQRDVFLGSMGCLPR